MSLPCRSVVKNLLPALEGPKGNLRFMSTRIEKDTMGEIPVESCRYWGAQTQRSIQNFPIGPERFKMHDSIVRAMGILKKGAAQANKELGELPPEIADLVVKGPKRSSTESSTIISRSSCFKPVRAHKAT